MEVKKKKSEVSGGPQAPKMDCGHPVDAMDGYVEAYIKRMDAWPPHTEVAHFCSKQCLERALKNQELY